MKTEFDKLVKSRIDEGDFPYNPANWEQLADRMDGDKGRRKKILWIPLTAIASITSIAASLAMIITIPVLMHQAPEIATMAVNNKPAQERAYMDNTPENDIPGDAVPAAVPATNNIVLSAPAAQYVASSDDKSLAIHISERQGAAFDTKKGNKVADNNYHPGNENNNADILKTATSPYYTFEPDEQGRRTPRTTISISGGYLSGTLNKGFVVGATAKRNITDKLYIESDVAFVNNGGTDKVPYNVPIAGKHIAAKTVGASSGDLSKEVNGYVVETRDQNYTMSYAQVTPSIGYNLLRRVSVGVGADLQQLLQNDRQDVAVDATKDNIKEVPGFDVGLIAKTECTVSKKIKAGLYYRQGLDNFISTYNKYIDRSYVQFQLKYTLFNK